MKENPARIRRLFYIVLIVLTIALRLWRIGYAPGKGALNQDEAMAGYESWSLLNYGTDSNGYHNPVYLEAWGSGMNALETYLMMPFIAILGLNSLSVRLPQAVTAVFTILAFYFFVKEMNIKYADFKEKGRDEYSDIALISAFMLCISPWHIMMSRWALESNLLPGFVLFGLLFLLKARKNSKWILLSMLFFGLSLYAYAVSWIMLPVIIFASLVFLIATKQLKADRYFVAGILILFVLALPLMLFLLVNKGYLNEIILPFLSIPKLSMYRGGDIDIKPVNMFKKMEKLLLYLRAPKDDFFHIIEGYGLYYRISVVFQIIGISAFILRLLRNIKSGDTHFVMGLWFLTAFAAALTVGINANHINMLHIPMIYFTAYGIYYLTEHVKKDMIITACIVVYTAYLASFCGNYFFDYSKKFASEYYLGIDKALEYAKENSEGTIHIRNVYYSNILYSLKLDTSEFLATVEYEGSDTKYRRAVSFGRFDLRDYYSEINNKSDLKKGDAYVVTAKDGEAAELFKNLGLEGVAFENSIVYLVK